MQSIIIAKEKCVFFYKKCYNLSDAGAVNRYKFRYYIYHKFEIM